MPLSSLEYKKLMLEFGSDLEDVADDLYEATTDEITAVRKAAIVSAGERKLREYEALLGKLQGVGRTEAEKRYGDIVGRIRKYLTTIKK